MLQEKATRIAEASEVSGEQFKASNGWPDRFKRRTGIKAKFISGESGDVREETVADSWIERLPVILQGWHPRDIWNMGERGQFFRALPNRSLTEASQSCTGGKKSKDRLTCAFIVNARGGKEKPIIIGESANPKCFRGIQNRSLLPLGMLDAEGNTNAVECSNSDVDPFSELQDEFAAVESLAKETSGASAVSIKETVNGSFDPPVCFELPDNWEDTFFREVALERGEETNDAVEIGASEDEIDEPPATVMPKMASYKEATSSLQEVLNFLEAKGNIKTANDLVKVIYSIQSDWLKPRRSQSKLTDFLKPFKLANDCVTCCKQQLRRALPDI
ncbi:Tigger transposable element-derived protein 4 [Stylophora pistillata]|uniref:Tigger transposable element-derived protein 4 n=1 Tax=Stylophora pistillata TaxID=50429 RepID=A0A2B4ST84_STYPI|nr:Tigger transposable element-derived protein 4 [Stylophora pistillata]